MDTIFLLYGTLILTIGGFILPFLTIILAAFPKARERMKQNYLHEQSQTKENLNQELEKLKNAAELDSIVLREINNSVAALKAIKRTTEERLPLLNPKYSLTRVLTRFGSSFLSLLFGIYFYPSLPLGSDAFFIISLIAFISGLIILFNAIDIIMEASSIAKNSEDEKSETQIELLKSIFENVKKDDTPPQFIEPSSIIVNFYELDIIENTSYSFAINSKKTIYVRLINDSGYMLKLGELGFYFPAETLIEGSEIANTYTTEKQKLVRFKYDYIHSKEKFENKFDITFLKEGSFEIDAFVKGENLITKRLKFKIEVVN